MIGGWWKPYYKLQNNCKLVDFWICDIEKLLFETLVTYVILYGHEVCGCNISRASWVKIEIIQNKFIPTMSILKEILPIISPWLKQATGPHWKHAYDYVSYVQEVVKQHASQEVS